jgi:hypothetical protein
LESFDLPAMNPNCLQRSDSLVPTQALHLWNDTAIRHLSLGFANRVIEQTDRQQSPDASVNSQIELVYQLALGRSPHPDERSACIEVLSHLKETWMKQDSSSPINADEAGRRALATVCHTIWNSAAFLYID